MITYEYQCESCGCRFERRQAITEPALDKCPECGGEAMQLISGGSAFIVKGGAPGRERASDCAFESSGRTCCGREERCGKPPCGN